MALSLNPGGTERLILDLVTRLHDRIPMAVCCIDQAGDWASTLAPLNVKVTAVGRQPGFRPSTAWAIADAARAHGATVIHAHHYSPFVYSCLSQLRRRTPVVFTEHGRTSDSGPSPKRRLANRALGRVPSRMYAVSAELGTYLEAEGLSPVNVIYNGIEPGPPTNAAAAARLRSELGASPETLIVGTIARLDPVKDLGTLLRAVGLVSRERQILLLIVGDGPERAALEALARELAVESSVKFLGKRDDAREWLWACDAYVNSSISEGVSLTILEAMAAGLPVVATSVGGTPEVVTSACGTLVPARSPERLAEAIRAIDRDRDGARAKGRAARARVESVFSLDRMVRDYADVYQRVSAGERN